MSDSVSLSTLIRPRLIRESPGNLFLFSSFSVNLALCLKRVYVRIHFSLKFSSCPVMLCFPSDIRFTSVMACLIACGTSLAWSDHKRHQNGRSPGSSTFSNPVSASLLTCDSACSPFGDRNSTSFAMTSRETRDVPSFA